MLEEGLTLQEWLISTQERRDELDAFGKSKLPSGISTSEEMDISIQCQDDAARLLADAESYLTMETARAVLTVNREHDELSAEERKAIVKDMVRNIKRLVEGVSVTHNTLKTRIFVLLNANRSR